MATLNHRRPRAFSFGRVFLFFFSMLVFLAWAGLSSSNLLAQATPQLVSRIFSYGAAPRSEVESTVKSLLTKDGKYVFIAEKQTVMVQDIQERVEMIGAVLADLARPQPNVRIELTFQEFSGSQSGGVQVNGNVGMGNVRVNNYPARPGVNPNYPNYPNSRPAANSYPRNGITIDAGSTSLTRSSNSGQFLVVQGGQSASIEVASQVPFVDYFYTYANTLGLPVPAVRWESVGTRMSVRPEVQGDMIRVEIVPEISALTGGQYQILSFKTLATVVTVPNGVPVQIGGFKGAADDFNRNFFSGGSSSRSTGNATFTLKATVQ